jgi:hypothetical protein
LQFHINSLLELVEDLLEDLLDNLLRPADHLGETLDKLRLLIQEVLLEDQPITVEVAMKTNLTWAEDLSKERQMKQPLRRSTPKDLEPCFL